MEAQLQMPIDEDWTIGTVQTLADLAEVMGHLPVDAVDDLRVPLQTLLVDLAAVVGEPWVVEVHDPSIVMLRALGSLAARHPLLSDELVGSFLAEVRPSPAERHGGRPSATP